MCPRTRVLGTWTCVCLGIMRAPGNMCVPKDTCARGDMGMCVPRVVGPCVPRDGDMRVSGSTCVTRDMCVTRLVGVCVRPGDVCAKGHVCAW